MALRVALFSLALSVLLQVLGAGLAAMVFAAVAGRTADLRETLGIGAITWGVVAPVVVTPLVWVALRYRSLSARLHLTALTDPLTAVPNRRAFFNHAEAWLSGLEPRRFALLMIDADRFKDLNDRHGHEAGDTALRGIAERIGQGLAAAGAPGALVARLGGEEFAVLLEDCGPQEAVRAAAAVCEAVRSLDFRHRGRPIPLTVSVGVWAGVATEVDGPLAEADLAVYRAKAAGRDRWEMAEGADEVFDSPAPPVPARRLRARLGPRAGSLA